MKGIVFSRHALDTMEDRGATTQEVAQAIRVGERVPAKGRRVAFRKNFPYRREWKGRFYETKQVMPIVAEESEQFVVVTVYVFFLGGGR